MSVTEIPFKDGRRTLPIVDYTPLKHAAIYVGERCFIGWRHASIMAHMRGLGLLETVHGSQQGFVDEAGFWWNRSRSAVIALRTGQLQEVPHTLLSEHLWGEYGQPLKPEPKRRK